MLSHSILDILYIFGISQVLRLSTISRLNENCTYSNFSKFCNTSISFFNFIKFIRTELDMKSFVLLAKIYISLFCNQVLIIMS